jgi:4-amino-4-deoxy-L-arabinose transferase-like glycosyltransferase
MLLMAALASVVAWQLFHAVHDEFGVVSAGLIAFFLLGLPLFREYYAMVMAETLSMALIFAATLAFGRFLDDERNADAVWFGVLAALAILTKGTGLALVVTAPIALVFTRKWQLLTRPALWAAVAITAILAGPWTYYFRNAGREHGGWEEASPSWLSASYSPFCFSSAFWRKACVRSNGAEYGRGQAHSSSVSLFSNAFCRLVTRIGTSFPHCPRR